MKEKEENPLSDIISDKDYKILIENRFLIPKEVRNYKIRKQYKKMKDAGLNSIDAVKTLSKEHKLKVDSYRKIIYEKIGKMKKILLIAIMLLGLSGSVKADPLTDVLKFISPYPILIGDWIIIPYPHEFEPIEL